MSLPTRLENPVERDPHDFGSREFWKTAHCLTVRRWAEMSDEAARLRGLVEWADTLLCNVEPHSVVLDDAKAAEWDHARRMWRDEANKPQQA